MFIIELTYKADLEELDAQMTAHMKFLRKYYASGHFLISGRQLPRVGGIIVAMGKDKEEIERIMREDPFTSKGLADARIIEFRASQRAEDIEERLKKEPSR